MLTHIDENLNPVMVDVSEKAVTLRTAEAESLVYLPLPIIPDLRHGGDLVGPKGPVFHTAVVAGIMGAKRTWELIPMCHPLPVEKCSIHLEIVSETEVRVACKVSATHKTGVEMEALTGASIAALTLYDMVKALSPAIEIRYTRLLTKEGGKRSYHRG